MLGANCVISPFAHGANSVLHVCYLRHHAEGLVVPWDAKLGCPTPYTPKVCSFVDMVQKNLAVSFNVMDMVIYNY